MEDSIHFEEIDQPSHPWFDAAFQIYLQSFPSNERQPVDIIKKRIELRQETLIVGVKGQTVIMMAFVFNLEDPEFKLLDYIAVSPMRQNAGFGTAFFSYLKNNWDKYLVLEVEDPAQGNRDQRERRINFYRNQGAKMMTGVHYVLPSLDGTVPTKMKLMLLPEYPGGLSKDRVRALITRLYREVYRKSSDDLDLKMILDQLPDEIRFA